MGWFCLVQIKTQAGEVVGKKGRSNLLRAMDPIKRFGRSFLSLLSVSGRMAPTHGRHGWILNVSTDRTRPASLAFAASQLARSRDQYGRLNGMTTMARLPAAGTSPGPK